MRRLIINIAAIAAVVLSSCSREDVLPEQDGSRLPGEFTPLTISTGEMTRTSLSGTAVNWSDDDQIAVFDDLHYNNEFDAVDVNGSVAVFEGKVRARTTDFYAVYPYSDAVKADAEAIYVSLPSDQTPVSGTFAEEHNISIAHGTKTAEADVVDGIVFKNVCALVQFTVPQRLAEVAEVSFTANNRTVAGDLKVAKSDLGVTCISGVNTVKMTGDFSAGSTFYFVVTPGEINGFSAKVTTKNGATYTKSSTKSFVANAGAIKNLGEIDFTSTPTATAAHTYENGILTGTAVTLHLGLPSGMEEYVDGLNASLLNSNNNEIRIIRKTSGVKPSEYMEVAYGNTYIPQGKYKIYVTYSLNGVAKEEQITVEVPAPEFTVTADAYTSYSKYSQYCDTNGADASLLNDANACDGSTMYDIRFSVSISDAVLAQYNMTYSVGQLAHSGGGVYLNADSRNTSGNIASKGVSTFYKMQSYPSLKWGQYSLRAEAEFDGVTKSTVKTLHVTGLPYKAVPMIESDWTLSSWNNEYKNGYIQLGGVSGSGEASATSKMQFQIPSTIHVKLNTNVTIRAYYLWPKWYNTNFTVKINNTQIISQDSDNQDNNNTGKNYNLSGSSTFTPSAYSVVMNSSYTSAGPWSKIHSMEILYR